MKLLKRLPTKISDLSKTTTSLYTTVSTRPMGFEPAPGHLNYYLGHIPEGRTNINGYQRMVYPDVYDKIDLHYYSNRVGLKYYFVVNQGGNPNDIIIEFTGANSVNVKPDGGLKFTTVLEDKDFLKGIVYYENASGISIPLLSDGNFVKIDNNKVRFDIHSYYPPDRPLIICVAEGFELPLPTADDWSTFHGGNAMDVGYDVVTDNLGNPYFVGSTQSNPFPNIFGSQIQTGFAGGKDAFLIKFDKDGIPIFGIYYGGTGNDEAFNIALNSTGDIYFVGQTYSSDFPLKPISNTILKGTNDGFIIKIDNSGQNLLLSRYFGGDADDIIRSIAIDDYDNVYVVGNTSSSSSTFPLKPKNMAYNQNFYAGSTDAFIAEFDVNNGQIWGSYFGGYSQDNFSCVKIGSDNNIFITGSTYSDNPASSNPTNTPCGVPQDVAKDYFPDCNPNDGYTYYQNNYIDYTSEDAIIVQFDQNGALKWSTYFGGTGNETSFYIQLKNSIEFDPVDNKIFYIIGSTNRSTNFPLVFPSGSYNQTIPSGSTMQRAYIAKFNNRFLEWSSLFGGGTSNKGYDITIDKNHIIYITGSTTCQTPADASDYCIPPNTTDEFPICKNNYVFSQDDLSGNPHFGGVEDSYIAGFSNNKLIWSTYYGGASNDINYGITYDNVYERIYITGNTKSYNNTDFPVIDPGTSGTYMQKSNTGNYDAIVARFNVKSSLDVDKIKEKNNDIIFVYPNPASKEFNIYLNNRNNIEYEIILYNSIGKKVYYAKVTNETQQIDISDYSRGLYILKINFNNNIYTSKIVIE